MDDLGLLSGDSARDQKFLTQQLMKADLDSDGVISFEEFKVRAADDFRRNEG